jgi:UDP-N-acetylglucosamine 2-epimerase
MVIVQGDTTTVMAAALAAFYHHVPVGHVEAGLRTRDSYNPFPEEINRRIAGVLSTLHFAPTPRAVEALKSEQVPEATIRLTGNTVVDALLMTSQRPVALDLGFDPDHHTIVLVTAHRRESFGVPFEMLCHALKDIVDHHPEVHVIYPVHLNPNVHIPVLRILGQVPRVRLLDPLRYEQFVHLLSKAHLVLTDSGGIQEEAPVFGIPTLIMREKTERREALEAGTAMLVGTHRKRIVEAVDDLLADPAKYRKMACSGSPFGDGHAAERIVDCVLSNF